MDQDPKASEETLAGRRLNESFAAKKRSLLERVGILNVLRDGLKEYTSKEPLENLKSLLAADGFFKEQEHLLQEDYLKPWSLCEAYLDDVWGAVESHEEEEVCKQTYDLMLDNLLAVCAATIATIENYKTAQKELGSSIARSQKAQEQIEQDHHKSEAKVVKKAKGDNGAQESLGVIANSPTRGQKATRLTATPRRTSRMCVVLCCV